MWMCENKHFFDGESLTCPICGKPRMPPDWSFYVHNILLPKLSVAEREEWLKYFTTLFSDGFESGDFSAWTAIGGSPTIVTSPVHHGFYAMQTNVLGNYCYKNFTQSLTTHLRAYVRYSGSLANGQYIAFLWLSDYVAGKNMGIVQIYNDAGTYKWRLRIMSPNIGVFVSNQQLPSPDTWYCVELEVTAGTSGEYRVYINGSELTDVTHTGLNTGSNGARRAYVGQVDGYSGLTITIDCVAVADTYIGPEVPPKPRGSIVVHAKLAGVI
jgi:hypothetical protein